jgi:hypothetical protein
MARDYLWNWTGRRFGLCEVTLEPCREDCTEGRSTYYGSGPAVGGVAWRPVIIDGAWFNIGCGRCGDRCGCGGAAPLRLPGPVASVTQVVEDGIILDPASYYVVGSGIARTDGAAWSPCGLEITYVRGTAVPVGGQQAAGLLARELALASCRDKACQLPQRLQTVSRQGVTVAMLDSFDDIDKGHTGIWSIDSWIASVTKPPTAARILSPDIRRRN